MVDPGETKFVKSGDAWIAYRVTGDGPVDLVYIPGVVNTIDAMWNEPEIAAHVSRLASFSRLILLDKRGSGLSDGLGPGEVPTVEQRMDDVRAVMDAAGSDQAALFATADGGPLGMVMAASHPDRVRGLALYATSACLLEAPDHPIGLAPSMKEAYLQGFRHTWGDPEDEWLPGAPSLQDDPHWRAVIARMARRSCRVDEVVRYWEMNLDLDVRHVLPTIQVPVVVLHVADDAIYPIEHGRWVAEHIDGARFIELEGTDHLYFAQNGRRLADELERFLGTLGRAVTTDRVLATVLFTDIVDSTARSAELGDRRWRRLLDEHDSLVAREVERRPGRRVKSTGDGALATFDGPGRGLDCALALRDAVRALGLEIRAGLHTGEVERRGDDIGGLAVHVASRVESAAGPGEVVASRTVKDLVVGSDHRFESRGARELKGVPGEWELYAVS